MELSIWKVVCDSGWDQAEASTVYGELAMDNPNSIKTLAEPLILMLLNVSYSNQFPQEFQPSLGS